MKNDMKMDFDDWASHCPICEAIVKHDDWPRKIECGEIDSREVANKEKHPPCIVCGSLELTETFITLPTGDNKGVSHTRLLACPSCGTGQFFEGTDAITGKPKVVFKHPQELDRHEITKQIQKRLDEGEEQNEDLLQKARFCIAVEAFFRPLQFYCLDKGWDLLGYGVRPLERTEIMTRFYEWTNREAMSEADESTNPLRREAEHKKRKRKWRR
ncbi:MAG: hypothetical protein CMA60_00235 [Euryarchaeota archaeon]|nr:hypothetical protein [Euryarchaeota archaeon]|tara:strand:- start:8670 stop:9311 length:642 start_codon:yes stop_codon:yes gene_type:complete